MKASSCSNENRNLVKDSKGILRMWDRHLFTIWLDDDDDNSATRENELSQINNVDVDFPSSRLGEFRVAI